MTINIHEADEALAKSDQHGIELASYHQPHPREFGATVQGMLNGPFWVWEQDNYNERTEFWRQRYYWAMRINAELQCELKATQSAQEHLDHE